MLPLFAASADFHYADAFRRHDSWRYYYACFSAATLPYRRRAAADTPTDIFATPPLLLATGRDCFVYAHADVSQYFSLPPCRHAAADAAIAAIDVTSVTLPVGAFERHASS
jgi:hypothetical protein